VRWIRWVVWGVLGVLVLGVGGIFAGAWLSLDRDREHARATARLPRFDAFGGPALVRIPARGMEFRARLAGDRGPGVILLHGFPATSAMYAPLLDAGARDGYRMVAFDQRGYSPGARPGGVDAYVVRELVDDVLAVADAVGFDTFHLVGHDWGSAVGWGVVASAPERVRSWTALSIPHPAAFTQALDSDRDQQARCSYIRLLQLPFVAETMFSFNGLAMLRNGVYQDMSSEERSEYLRVFAEPGALTGALNWYRAIAASRAQAPDETKVTRPTLFIWGNQDGSVGRGAVEAQRVYLAGPFREIELDAAHWLMETRAGEIVPEILAHWRSVDGDRTDDAEASEYAEAPRSELVGLM